MPDHAFGDAILDSHAILIDGFATHFRKLYQELGAERFALPGAPEAGHVVHGYEITRSVWFDNQRGFAIGHNPGAPDPFVCWQFTVENGARDFYWGRYCDSEKAAENYYAARTLVHMRDESCREISNPLAAAEMSAEQNYNMIDGLRNNTAVPKADLTDGQTHEEIRELAPESLAGEKPSVLEQIKEAKDRGEKGAAMTKDEFALWQDITENSRFHWTEDAIFRLNGRGAFYYIGGEEGGYMRIHKDGRLEVGAYEGAIPHIGEALFMPKAEKQHADFNEAFTAAIQLGGKRFLVDMFGGTPAVLPKSPHNEKPSVRDQIREATDAPRPKKDTGKTNKSKNEAER